MLEENRRGDKASEYAKRVLEGQLIRSLKEGRLPFVWCQGEVLADRSSKITSKGKLDPEGLMGP